MNKQIVEVKKNYDDLLRDIDKTSNNANDLRKQNDNLVENNEKLEKELKALHEKHDSLVNEFEVSSKDIQNLKKKSEKLKKETPPCSVAHRTLILSDFFLKQVFMYRTGAAIPNISDTDLSNILIKIPSEKIISEVSTKMKKAFQLQKEAKRQIQSIVFL